MKIAGFKPGHDGTVALIDGDELVFSLESEKDSFPRYAELGPRGFHDFLELSDTIPDVFATGGWPKGFHSKDRPQGPGYYGIGEGSYEVRSAKAFGKDCQFFMSTHERSHVWGSYGLSPFPNGQPVLVLVWEGNIGRYYKVDEKLQVHGYDTVLVDPGNKYSFLYDLADPTWAGGKGKFRFESAGKLMALAAYGEQRGPTPEEQAVIDWVLGQDGIILSVSKNDLSHTPYFNCGLQSQLFTDLALQFSNAIYERFMTYAKKNLPAGMPLVIGGGCGLNCEWNSRFKASGHFSDVFIPPMVNDSGSAIGTALDAKQHFTGNAKVKWSAYCGLDLPPLADPQNWMPYDSDMVAADLAKGAVIAFLHGRTEAGPRALGHRSLLAAPFTKEMTHRLNVIKGREGFRPIAPIVLAEDASKHFSLTYPSPHMLHFSKVVDPRLQAITHVDGSARPQTVSDTDEPKITALLRAFRNATGAAVLCNTSLNFNGRGFINNAPDAVEYATDRELDGVVYGDYYRRITR